MCNQELILNRSGSLPSSVKKDGAGHLGRLVPSGRTDIPACCGLGGSGGSGGGGGTRSGLGFLEGGGLGDAGGAGPGLSGLSESESWSGSGLGAPS